MRAPEPESWSVSLAPSVSADGHAAILSGLIEYNEQQAGPGRHAPVAVYVIGQDGNIVGGLEGRTSYGWLIIELVYLPAECRRRGFGRRVLREAEDEAIRRGCHAARLDTSSFQARGFYEKQGYAVFGELPLRFDGHRLFFLSKELATVVS